MIKKHTIPFILFFWLFVVNSPAWASQEVISLNIPASVISKIVRDVLPVQLDIHSEMVVGELAVMKVEDIQFDDQHVSCVVGIAGKNLQLVTELMGNSVKMKVGNIEVNFRCNVVIRFDRTSQTLFIRPVVLNNARNEIESSADISAMIMALLNGREFPVSLDKLEPIVFRASNKTIVVNNLLSDIQVSKEGLLFKLIPSIKNLHHSK